ncbi:hypothetical protein VitviT2T_006406 [Vitis vinifera]|uniref:non-specific serine/threonine protein kinase n=2 Tax=Vitis vinifera TaxID=29760 RepID=D7T6M2_VITVI|eukprot:XP_010649820.1 PREDICTED: receptor-like cytosolic serine/threonine-protein kinase RBK2 isoform X1 [Vitis vinifera]
MEDVREPSASPCVGSGNIGGENAEGKVHPVADGEHLSSLSVSISAEDSATLNMEERKEGPSPRGVLEGCLRSVESETASSKASTSDSETPSNTRSASNWHRFSQLFKKGSAMGLQTLPSLGIRKLSRSKSRRARGSMIPALYPSLDAGLCLMKPSWKAFSLSELETATDNFSHKNLIGEGGYAEVYKGQLQDGQFVAIKRIIRGTPEEMTVDFLSELGIIVHIDHPNTAKLVGYGVEGGMHLVLYLSPHGSLASLLYSPEKKLEWEIRYKIALGTAEGLGYLHEGGQRRIIHRDIKASNILLKEDFEPQISDFGLAKWLPEQCTHHIVSGFEGTFGYLPPEYFLHGIVDEKTDVYAYGVLLLELITGRPALDSSQKSLVMWAKPLLINNSIDELVDPRLADAYDSEQMNIVATVSSLCLHQSSVQRPRMNQVVQVLKGREDISTLGKRYQKPILQRTYSEELLDAEEYNSTKHLNDLSRHMEILLEI